MAWTWRCEAADGSAVTPPEGDGESFPSQADAENWIGETWRALLAGGVHQVVLFEDEREVYGPMGLSAP